VSGDLRAVLEALAFGDDPRIAPGDRLRAAGLLLELAPTNTPDAIFEHVLSLDDHAVNTELDDLIAAEVAAAVAANDGTWPNLTAALRPIIEERARELSDRASIEQGIEKKAATKARWLLEREVGTLASEALSHPETETQPDTPDITPETVTSRPGPVPAPPGVEPLAGFGRRARVRRLGG